MLYNVGMSNTDVHTLDNGLRVVFEPRATANSAAMTLLTPAGIAGQPDSSIGVANVLAEMIARGAGGLGAREHADALDQLGVQRVTSSATHHLQLSAVCLGRHLNAALPRLLDMATRPALESSAFGPSVDLALQACQALVDEPQQRAMIELRRRHRPTPYNRHPLGEEDALKALTLEDVRTFWAKRCVPGGAILSFAGQIDPEPLLDALQGHVAKWTGEAEDASVQVEPEGGHHHTMADSAQCHIALGCPAVPAGDADETTQRAAIAVLSGGTSSRLFSEVREKRGLCYAVSASYVAQCEQGAVYAYAGTTPPRAQETLDIMLQEFDRLQQGLIDDEFDRAMTGLKARLVMQGESTQARANANAMDLHTYGRTRTLSERKAQYNALTPDAINEFLAAHPVRPESSVVLGPAALKVAS